jgi:hypothetical protein
MNKSYFFLMPLVGIATIITMVDSQILAESVGRELATIAQNTTVMIEGQNSGSGVIIAKSGNTYSVLTAKHVIATDDEYEIVTGNGETYRLDYSKVEKLTDVDLAIAYFNSERNYQTANLGNSLEISLGTKIYIAGWPHPEAPINQNLLVLTEGNIAAIAPRPLPEGYQLVYTNITKTGMSGGPIFNQQGEVIGIHGQGQGRRIYLENYQQVDLKSGFNLGIPLQNLYHQQLPHLKLPAIASNISLDNQPQSYWNKAPRLIDNATTYNNTRVKNATYYFTVTIPPDAGAPLQQLTFQQTQWADFWTSYDIEKSQAFEGTRRNRGTKIPLELISLDEKNETITVVFSSPIAPGNTITIGLKPHQTPNYEGVYLFQITAFPPGGASRSLNLGIARLHFYQNRN